MNPWSRLCGLFRRTKLDADMRAELHAHLEEQTRRYVAAGMSDADARAAAHRQFGHVDRYKEQCRDTRPWNTVTLWAKDLRLALRALRRAPAFSSSVLATLALCLGPNIAILSVLHTLVFKPLPFEQPEELVQVQNVYDRRSAANPAASFAQYRDFTEHADLFSGFALIAVSNATFAEESAPVRVEGYTATADLFTVLGIAPVAGHFFTREEERAGNNQVVVLTQTFWENQYAGDPGVIGRAVRMGGETYTILGVAPRSLEAMIRGAHVLRPFGVEPWEGRNENRYAANGSLVARLKPGIEASAGLAQLVALEARYRDEEASPEVRSMLETGGHRIALQPLGEQDALAVQTPLFLLQGGALFVLLIGCLNVANLLLARGSTRRSELVLRHALGAGPGALLRHMACESLLLVTAAGVAGVALAAGGLTLINRYLPLVMRLAPPVTLDFRMLAVAWVAILLIAVLVVLLPFWLLWRSDLRPGPTRTASAGARVRALGSTLVVAQVAVALVLLIGCGLLVHSFLRVVAIQPGFAAQEVFQGRIALPRMYLEREAGYALQQRVRTALREIPGVQSAALVADFGVARSYRTSPVTILGSAAEAGQDRPFVYLQFVSPEYFATMGIPILEGQNFSEDDNREVTPTVIVDQEFVRRHLPGQPALGRELVSGSQTPPPDARGFRIIGVAGRAHVTGAERRDGPPIVYLAINRLNNPGFNVLVRSTRDAASLLPEVREKIRAIDPSLPLYQTGTLQVALDGMLANRRGVMLLVAVFAAIALLLSMIGLYGVLAYDVSQRTREIGIRGAIGATRQQIVAMILRQGLWKAGVGLGIGLGGAFCLTRFMRGLLFEVTPADPVSFAVVSALLLVVALLASWLPARRAAQVDPNIALRAE